ncbi:Hypothetical Protein NTJ_11669 [Nesidiocoris tenuis]|uniref:Peptidase A2 domain-containing protein n=1 Tax=Nesidiocoris tenuis TaxID=355587 RepID=A0ABN7B3R5_9HEMI|nr:Hypothetical Protein NTJ_11669 [Nesidiocoris tenuis]
MLFDTGATKTVISEKVWREIGSPPLKKSSSLLAYTGVKVDTLGKAKVLVKAFGKELKLQVLVTKQEDIPLFGMNWLIAFDVPMPQETRIRTLTNTAQIPEKQTEIDKDVAKIVEKYEEIFQAGTGKIKNYQVTIKLKENAIPKVFKPRRVPFSIQPQVEKELERLQHEEIIEEVDVTATPIEWATPLVIATKSNGKIRICSDFLVILTMSS